MGADYKKKQQGDMSFGGGPAVGAGATSYLGAGYGAAVEAQAINIVPYAAILHILHTRAADPGAGNNSVHMIRVNGIDTGITTTHTVGVFDAEDLVNDYVVARGDRVSLRTVNSVAAAATRVFASILMTRI